MHNLIFRGEILPGHECKAVEIKLAELFGVKPERMRPYFKGKVFIKKDMDLAKAKRYQKAFKKAGAKCYFEPPLPQTALAETAAAAPVFSGTVVCDHCGASQPAGEKCTQCGIHFARYRVFKAKAAQARDGDLTMTLEYLPGGDDALVKRKRRAVVGVQVAASMLIALFAVDMFAQSFFIDVTRLPYILPLLVFCYAFKQLAMVKGYRSPIRFALLGMASFVGLSAMLMLKNMREANPEYLFKSQRILPIVLLSGSAVWGYFQYEKFSALFAFREAATAMERIRSDYPTNLISDANEVERIAHEMEQFVKFSLELIKASRFRPNEVSGIGDTVFKEVSKYFICLQYQRYLNAKTNNRIPAFLSDAAIAAEMKKYRDFFETTVPKIKHARLDASFHDWVAGLASVGKNDSIVLNKDLGEIKSAISAYLRVKQQLPVSMEFLLEQRPNIANMAKMQWEQNGGTITISTAHKGKLADHTVVMAYYKHPDSKKLMYTRIGGTLPDKYMDPTRRVLSPSYHIGATP